MKAIAVSSKTPVCGAPFGRRCRLLPLFLTCFAFGQTAQAVSPAPDGGYTNNNTAEGTSALLSLSSGVDNTALGFQALYHNTTSSFNTAEGFRALFSNNGGTQNTATGLQGLFSNTTGSFNTANGVNSLFHNSSGALNTATGVNALFSNSTAPYNTADGVNALYRNTTGTQNTATGVQALFNNTTGSFNTAVGLNALYYNTIGSGNIVIGRSAGFNLTVGSNNIDIGNQGVAGESGIIRIGTEGVHTDTFPAGRIHIGLDSDAAFKIEPSDGSPHAGFVRFGDNTGWQLRFARSRESSGGPLNTGTTGTMMMMLDNGNVSIGGLVPPNRLLVTDASVSSATPSGHIVLIKDYNGVTTAGLAIQTTSPGNPSIADNFITFFSENGASVGSIEGNGSGGVQLGTAGSDYAEYLPKADPADKIGPTQIVGVRDGRIVPRGVEADQYMVVTEQAIVAGNRPSEDAVELAKRSLVSFIGQVPVQVRGPVQSGDFILAAENGTGIAVPAGNIPPSAMHRVVGRAWETSAEEGVQTINAVVGVDQTSLVVPALEHLERENRELRATVEQQQKQIQLLGARLTEHEAQIQKVSAQLELNKAAAEMAANP